MRKGVFLSSISTLCRTGCVLLVLLTLFVAGHPVPAGAAGTKEPPGLQALIDYALQNNQLIKARKAELEATKNRKPWKEAFDDPMLSYIHPVEPVETRRGPQERTLKITQKLPFPGKLRLEGEIVSQEIEVARLLYEMAVRDVVTEVKKLYYELYYLDRAIELEEENRKILAYFKELAMKNYSVDEKALTPLIRAEAKYERAWNMLVMLKERRHTISARLNAILDRPPAEKIDRTEDITPEPVDVSIDVLYEMAKDIEEIRTKESEMRKAELSERLSRLVYYPDFTLGLVYTEIGESDMPVEDSGKDALSFMVGINIPLWAEKNRGRVEEQVNRRLSVERKKELVLKEVLNRVRDAYYSMLEKYELMGSYRDDLIPMAKESMNIAEAWYKNGIGGLGELLETESMWINFRRAYYRTVADYLKYIAELERLTGFNKKEREASLR